MFLKSGGDETGNLTSASMQEPDLANYNDEGHRRERLGPFFTLKNFRAGQAAAKFRSRVSNLRPTTCLTLFFDLAAALELTTPRQDLLEPPSSSFEFNSCLAQFFIERINFFKIFINCFSLISTFAWSSSVCFWPEVVHAPRQKTSAVQQDLCASYYWQKVLENRERGENGFSRERKKEREGEREGDCCTAVARREGERDKTNGGWVKWEGGLKTLNGTRKEEHDQNLR